MTFHAFVVQIVRIGILYGTLVMNDCQEMHIIIIYHQSIFYLTFISSIEIQPSGNAFELCPLQSDKHTTFVVGAQ